MKNISLAAYGKFVGMILKEQTNFRVDFFLHLFTGFISSYAHVAVWIVIMASGGGVTPETAERTILYIALTGFAGAFIYAPDRDPVFTRVQSGDIARELLYPVSFPLVIFARGLGKAFFRMMFNGLITLAVITPLCGISWEIDPIRLGLLFLFLAPAFVISTLISFQVDMLAFWVYETTALHYIKQAVVGFFSGHLIPLWFYPAWIMGVLDILPFKNIVYVPIAFFLGELPAGAAPFHFAVSLLWCCFFTLTSALLWRAGVKKVVINGG